MLNLGLWAVVCIIAAVGVVRTWGASGSSLGAVAAAATPAVLVLAWPVAVLAALRHQWVLVIAAAFLAGCHLAWARRRRGRHHASQWSVGADPIVSLFTVNASFLNPDVTLIAAEIASNGADVVIILELTDQHVATLSTCGVLDDHPWSMVLPQKKGAWGIGLWSKLPIDNLESWMLQGVPQLRGRLQLAGGRALGIVAIHVPAPWPGSARRWMDGLAELGRAVGLETPPFVVTGDLNATWDHRRFRDLMKKAVCSTQPSRQALAEPRRGRACAGGYHH